MEQGQKIGVLTSGGDAPGMNATIRAVVRTGIYNGYEVWGIRRGFSGLLTKEFVPLARRSVGDIIHRGGTILHTARCNAFYELKYQEEAVENLKEVMIGGLVVIGGNGSIHGAHALQKLGMATVAIPATIDNDVAGTDVCIGFDTSVNTIVDAVNRLRDTATSHERIFVIEVMGRASGHLALAAGAAGGAESIVVPERPYNLQDICHKIQHGYCVGKRHHIIMVAEGVSSGHQLAAAITNAIGYETRVSVLGHIQRGGTPSAQDRILAVKFGAQAVESLHNHISGVVIGMNGGHIKLTPFDELQQKSAFDDKLHHLAQNILSL